MTSVGTGGSDRALHAVVVAAASLLDPSRLAAVSVAEVRRLLGCDGASLAFWDADLGVLVPLAFDDERMVDPDPVFYPRQGLIGEAFATEAAVAVYDYAGELAYPPAWSHVASGIAVPLRSGRAVLGALSAQQYTPRRFTAEEIELLDLIAAQVGPALDTMRTLARAQQRTAQAVALATLMRRGAAIREEEELFALICQSGVRLLGADLAGVVLRDTGAGKPSWRGVTGNRTDNWDARYGGEHPAAATIFGGEMLVVRGDVDGTLDPDRYPFFGSEEIRIGVSLPLEQESVSHGALCLGWRLDIELADAQLEFARALAGFAGTLVTAAAVRSERDALVGNAPVILAAIDQDGIVTLCEGAGAAAIGLGPAVVGRHMSDVLAGEPAALAQLREVTRGAIPACLLLELRGHAFDARIVRYGDSAFLVGTDVTGRLSAERELARRAAQDELTGLPNTSEVLRQMTAALATGPLSIVLADVRNFDQVNEAIGYDSADELLRTLGARVVEDLSGAVVVGRVGGDEFAVAARDEDPAALARRMRASLEAFVSHGTDDAMAVEVRCGYARMPAGGDAQRLLRNADAALQQARRGSGSVAAWDEQAAQLRRDQLSVVGELRRALAARAFEVAYQPILDLRDGKVHEVEALARWTRAGGEQVSPALFVSLAERIGRIAQLTAHVLDCALAEVAAPLQVTVDVNVSPLDLMHGDLPALVADRLAAHGLQPQALTLELTESAALEAGTSRLEELARLGIAVAVDDFGRGWSSLELLKRLPARRLKLDRSYVATAEHEPTDQAIIVAAVTLGHAFGMDVVAEGVETAGALETVGRLGCDLVQGFHIARPMSATDLTAWLAARPDSS